MRIPALFLMLVTMLFCRSTFGDEVHDAARVGNVERLKTLLKANPDLGKAKDKNGRTLLHDMNSTNVMEVLLPHGAGINAKDDRGWTPLHYAALRNQRKIAEWLLVHGVSVNAKDNRGCTTLHYAGGVADASHSTVAELLPVYGANEDAKVSLA